MAEFIGSASRELGALSLLEEPLQRGNPSLRVLGVGSPDEHDARSGSAFFARAPPKSSTQDYECFADRLPTGSEELAVWANYGPEPRHLLTTRMHSAFPHILLASRVSSGALLQVLRSSSSSSAAPSRQRFSAFFLFFLVSSELWVTKRSAQSSDRRDGPPRGTPS